MPDDMIIEPDDVYVDPEEEQVAIRRANVLVAADNERQISVIRARKGAYSRLFKGVPTPGDLAYVLEDLRAFCRGDQAAYDPDRRVNDILIGRQEVFYRIRDFTELSLDDLVMRYTEKE